MTTIQVQLSDALLAKLRDFAARENVPVDQLAASALAQGLEAREQLEYLASRAARGSREKYLEVLRKVPHVPPIPPDEPPPSE